MTTHITLIFHDLNTIKENICNVFCKYKCIFFDNQQSCVNYIVSRSISEILFLITSKSSAIEILPSINDLRQLDSIFIYSIEEEDQQFLDKYSKIIAIFSQQIDLFQCIEENIDLAIKQVESFKFYEQHQKSTRELSKESGSFLWLRLFKDIILKLPHDEQSKQEMIDKLKEYYHNNNRQLKLIEKFKQEYKSDDAIQWYTGQPFLYKQLNRALRTEDIELLYKFRYFISDLSKKLFTEYEILKDNFDCKLTFYRGVKLLNEEAIKLEENVGKLISTNGYLSTSLNKNVALAFADKSTDTETSIIFEIECDLGIINSVIMAPISHYNTNRTEQEVLFDLDAAFEILSVSRDESLKMLLVKMKVTDEGSILAQEYIQEHRKHINTASAVLVYGRLLTDIGQYDKSQEYFERLLENPNGEDLASIYYYLGVIQYYIGHYEKAIEYYESSYRILMNTIPPRAEISAHVLNGIGTVFSIRGQYDTALDYYIRALKISQEFLNYPCIAISLGSIGIIYRTKGEYDLALDNHMECHRIQEKYLPSEHKQIARTLNHIAAVYNDKDDLTNAMIYHKKSLKMNETCLPVGHDYIGSSLNHIATILTNQGKYDEALNYHNRSLKNKENIFPNGHVSIVKILSKIGYIYYLKKDYNLAFDYLNKSMKMREILFSAINDVSLINTLTYFGLVLIQQKKYDDALVYSMRAFNLAETLLPIGHEDITGCLTNIAIIYRELKDYTKALEYFEKALKNDEQNPVKASLIRLARNYDNLGICLYHQGNHKIGLENRIKAVRLISQVSPRSQYADWIDTVGNVVFKEKLFDYALECFLTSLNMRLDCLPNDHIDIAESLMFLGDVYIEKGYKIQARLHYEKALIIYEKKKHVNAIDILNCIGTIYENISKYHLALEYFRKAFAFSEKYFPSEDSLKETNQNNIARVKWFIK